MGDEQEQRQEREALDSAKRIAKKKTKDSIQKVIMSKVKVIIMPVIGYMAIMFAAILAILALITLLDSVIHNKSGGSADDGYGQADSIDTYMSQFGYENSEEFTAMYDTVKSETEACGLNQQQIFALTAIACNCNAGLPTLKKGTFTDVYEAGLAAGYEKNSWQHNKYIWDKWWFETPAEMADANRTKIADATFEKYAKGPCMRRRGGETSAWYSCKEYSPSPIAEK